MFSPLLFWPRSPLWRATRPSFVSISLPELAERAAALPLVSFVLPTFAAALCPARPLASSLQLPLARALPYSQGRNPGQRETRCRNAHLRQPHLAGNSFLAPFAAARATAGAQSCWQREGMSVYERQRETEESERMRESDLFHGNVFLTTNSTAQLAGK